MEDLYKKYLRNIKNGKIAIKKEYVDKGYFSYYSKKDLEHLRESKRIIIDGFNGSFNDYINKTINEIKFDKKISNKTIYLGKPGKLLSKKIMDINSEIGSITNYNISIAKYEILHMLNRHGNMNEFKRGQRMIGGDELLLLPDLIINTDQIVYLGTNKANQKIFNFISHNDDGTYNLIEFIGSGKKILGFQSLYINISKK